MKSFVIALLISIRTVESRKVKARLPPFSVMANETLRVMCPSVRFDHNSPHYDSHNGFTKGLETLGDNSKGNLKYFFDWLSPFR